MRWSAHMFGLVEEIIAQDVVWRNYKGKTIFLKLNERKTGGIPVFQILVLVQMQRKKFEVLVKVHPTACYSRNSTCSHVLTHLYLIIPINYLHTSHYCFLPYYCQVYKFIASSPPPPFPIHHSVLNIHDCTWFWLSFFLLIDEVLHLFKYLSHWRFHQI